MIDSSSSTRARSVVMLTFTHFNAHSPPVQVAEFDTPHNLIQKENGIFRQMCLKSGTFTELEAAAAAKAASEDQPIPLLGETTEPSAIDA